MPADISDPVDLRKDEGAVPGRGIPEAERIPFRQKAAFSAGMVMDYAATSLLTAVLWMPYFNIGLGISPATLGGILMILLAWNAFLDPVTGNLSDNFRSRWGRRRPFMLVAAVLAGCVFPIFWNMPATLPDAGKAAWILGTGLVFYSAYSFWAMPYYGLQMELTPNYDERTRLTGWMTFLGKIAYLGGGWVLAIFTSALFLNSQTGRGDIVMGMKTGGWIIGGVIAVFGVLPALFVKERFQPAMIARTGKESFWQSLRESIRCRPLWALIGVSFFLVLGSTSVSALGQYLNIYYVFHGDLAAASIVSGWKISVLVVSGISLIPVWVWLGERYDKRNVVVGMLVFSMGGHLLNILCIRPELPYLQIIPAVFESAAISAIWLFLPSMKADIADHDELTTRRRREGSINSFYSWFVKAALTCATGLGGVLLELSGFTAKAPQQPQEVLGRMFAIFLILPVCIWTAAAVIGWLYPLTRTRMMEVRGELEKRRGEPAVKL